MLGGEGCLIMSCGEASGEGVLDLIEDCDVRTR